MINSRKIEDLDPRVQEICRKHIELCKQRGVTIIVTSTWRDYESQDDLYAIGRTKEMHRRPVTNARAGKSWHNFRAAYDIVPLRNGKAVWDVKDPLWKTAIECGKLAGAEAGAEWRTFPDFPHFQLTAGLTLDIARQRFDESGSIFTA